MHVSRYNRILSYRTYINILYIDDQFVLFSELITALNAQSSLLASPDQPIIVDKFKYSQILCQLKCKCYIMKDDYPYEYNICVLSDSLLNNQNTPTHLFSIFSISIFFLKSVKVFYEIYLFF
jgi:hypothetical protein